MSFLVFQYSAPTAHAGQDDLRKLYEQIAHASYAAVTESRFDFSQGVSFQAVNDVLLPILKKTKTDLQDFWVPTFPTFSQLPISKVLGSPKIVLFSKTLGFFLRYLDFLVSPK